MLETNTSVSVVPQIVKVRKENISLLLFKMLLWSLMNWFFQGNIKAQMVGPMEFRGMNLTAEEFEYLMGKTGAIKTEIKDDPKPKVKDVMMSSLRGARQDDDLSDEGDW